MDDGMGAGDLERRGRQLERHRSPEELRNSLLICRILVTGGRETRRRKRLDRRTQRRVYSAGESNEGWAVPREIASHGASSRAARNAVKINNRIVVNTLNRPEPPSPANISVRPRSPGKITELANGLSVRRTLHFPGADSLTSACTSDVDRCVK